MRRQTSVVPFKNTFHLVMIDNMNVPISSPHIIGRLFAITYGSSSSQAVAASFMRIAHKTKPPMRRRSKSRITKVTEVILRMRIVMTRAIKLYIHEKSETASTILNGMGILNLSRARTKQLISGFFF